MHHRVAISLVALCFTSVFASACEDDNASGGAGAFDAGDNGFDANGPSSEGGGASEGGADASGDSGDDGGTLPPPPTPNDVYVNPTAGLDTNTGKSDSPFKSLTKAFSVVPGGAGVHLLDGTYDAANESGNVTVAIPADVNVRSENPGQAKITALIVKTTGGATALYDLVFIGTPQLNAVGTTKLLGARLTFLPTGFNILNVNDSAEVTLVGGTLDGQGSGTPIGGSGLYRVLSSGSLTLDGTTMQNTGAPGIRLDGPAPATKARLVVKNNAVFDNVGSTLTTSCFTTSTIVAGNNASVLVDHATLKNGKAAGVCVGEQVDVSIQNGTFTGNALGVNAQDEITTDNSSLTVKGSTFTDNERGIFWAASGKVDVSGSAFTNSSGAVNTAVTEGIEVLVAPPQTTVIVRTTTVHGAGYCVYIGKSPTTVATLNGSLGTGADPGKNDLSGCAQNGLRVELPAGETLDAQGNTWNAGVQNADGAGKYSAGTSVTGPATGTNYYLGAASTLNL